MEREPTLCQAALTESVTVGDVAGSDRLRRIDQSRRSFVTRFVVHDDRR